MGETDRGPESVGPDTAAAYRAAMSLPGVATLILPANAAWGEIADTPVKRAVLPAPEPIDAAPVRALSMPSGQGGALRC